MKKSREICGFFYFHSFVQVKKKYKGCFKKKFLNQYLVLKRILIFYIYITRKKADTLSKTYFFF
jgi:hypothetical protein